MSASPSERRLPLQRPTPPTILVAEDDEDMREHVAATFEAQGYRVLAAGSAEEALGLLRRERVDVILADYDLPRDTGAALLHQAINEGLIDAATRAVICTGYTYVPAPPGVPVIHKPIDPVQLVLEIERPRGVDGDHEPEESGEEVA